MSTPNTHIGAEKIREIMESSRNKDIFFLGAGGIMMSSLALLTKRSGYSTRGSDRTRSALTEKLEREGIEMFYGHSEDNLGENTGAVIYTVAVSPDNPEYSYAQKNGIPTISRADYLGYIMTEYKNRVGIAGMHGKSTCTSMCAEIFLSAAENGASDPTIVSGAEYESMNGAYYLGEKENFIFEACEYMDSFLDFNPTVAVLLNAEMEHVDYFKSIEQIRDSFAKYGSLVGDEGTVIYNADDENISISNLIYFMKKMLSEVFKRDVKVRLRPGFFPFVEPGFELDINCEICGGDGCPSCKNSGWLELCPCGMIHPAVLREGGIDTEKYTGFAFGLGLTRLAMMKYGVKDIRDFNSGKLKSLSQFKSN